MNLCKKCSSICGSLLLIVGILFLLKDINVWAFWGIEWYTAFFLIGGLALAASSTCADCGKCGCCLPEGKPKKK